MGNVRINDQAHEKLKQLAAEKSFSLAQYLERIIEYFHRTGKDPSNMNRDTVQILEKLEGIEARLNHTSVMTESVSQTDTPDIIRILEGYSTQLFEDPISCPVCKVPFSTTTFQYVPPNLVCRCGFALKIRFGDQYLQNLDILTLLAGGITREIPGIGRLSLETTTHQLLRQ